MDAIDCNDLLGPGVRIEAAMSTSNNELGQRSVHLIGFLWNSLKIVLVFAQNINQIISTTNNLLGTETSHTPRPRRAMKQA